MPFLLYRKLCFLYDKMLRRDRTASERNYVAEATRCKKHRDAQLAVCRVAKQCDQVGAELMKRSSLSSLHSARARAYAQAHIFLEKNPMRILVLFA